MFLSLSIAHCGDSALLRSRGLCLSAAFHARPCKEYLAATRISFLPQVVGGGREHIFTGLGPSAGLYPIVLQTPFVSSRPSPPRFDQLLSSPSASIVPSRMSAQRFRSSTRRLRPPFLKHR